MSRTKIEWADYVVNPLQDKIKGKSGRGYHCTKVSPGCSHCYAEGINNRFGNHLPFDDRPTSFELIQTELEKPLKWKKPRRIFWQSMGDLFHKDVLAEMIAACFGVMALSPQHTHIVLTKRADKMEHFFSFQNFMGIKADFEACWHDGYKQARHLTRQSSERAEATHCDMCKLWHRENKFCPTCGAPPPVA